MPFYPGAVMLGVLWLACGDPDDDTTVDTDDGVTETDTESDDTDREDTEDTDPASWDEDVATVSGTVTWHVDFDAEAESAGYVDCDYTRTYAGIEDRTAPWLCPSCDVTFRTDVEMTEGRSSCYRTFVPTDPAPREWIGFGVGTLWRTYVENYALSDLGTATVDGGVVSTDATLDYDFSDDIGDHKATFHIEGNLVIGAGRGDPYWGYHVPDEYACGWPKADPPEYTGDYSIRLGEVIPDAVFPDECGEGVRLHDLLGSWLVLDVSAKDCGPCQDMADGAPAFTAAMRDEGFDVRTVTLLEVSLDDPYTTASDADIYDWQFAFDLEDPILADRGWGYFVIRPAAMEIEDDFGFPTWLVIDPNGVVVALNVGFGGWDAVGEIIRANR